MPELYPDLLTFIACCLIMTGAQLIYATVGFGAGMFAVALLAMILPDLAGAVAVLLILTFVTEVSVLAQAWRETRLRLLLGLVPTMAIGLWVGTQVLLEGRVDFLCGGGSAWSWRRRGCGSCVRIASDRSGRGLRRGDMPGSAFRPDWCPACSAGSLGRAGRRRSSF